MGNLIVSWAFMGAFYMVFMRGYSTPDPRRNATFDYRRKVGDRFGLLPPSREPLGVLLWLLTALGFVAAIGFVLTGGQWVAASSGTMVGAFLLTLWRDNRWMKRQPDYQAAMEALNTKDDDDG